MFLHWFVLAGDSANAVPLTKKLRTRVTCIWGDRRGQPARSAMDRPRPGRTPLLIRVSPVPGKYACCWYQMGARPNLQSYSPPMCYKISKSTLWNQASRVRTSQSHFNEPWFNHLSFINQFMFKKTASKRGKNEEWVRLRVLRRSYFLEMKAKPSQYFRTRIQNQSENFRNCKY